MPNSAQPKKRLRQDAKRRLANKSAKSELNTLEKKLLASVAGKDKVAVDALFPRLVAKLDRAARRRVLHPNNAAHRKSRLARLVNGLG